MTANTLTDRDLDRAIAELRGWAPWEKREQRMWWPSSRDGGGIPMVLPEFSTDPAWTVAFLEEMRGAGVQVHMSPVPGEWAVIWYAEHMMVTPAPTLQRAVAEAWLAWKTAKAAQQ